MRLAGLPLMFLLAGCEPSEAEQRRQAIVDAEQSCREARANLALVEGLQREMNQNVDVGELKHSTDELCDLNQQIIEHASNLQSEWN